MTTVHDLRSRFSTSTNEHSAAIRGARSAFPGSTPQHASTNNARPPSSTQSLVSNSGAAAAASLAERRKVRPPNGAQTIATSANYAALRAHNKSQESLLSSSLDSSKLSPQTGLLTSQPGSARAPSPSNVAAALAAARSAPRSSVIAGRPASRPTQTSDHHRFSGPITDGPDCDLPSRGTVGDVTKWLQSLSNEVELAHDKSEISTAFTKSSNRREAPQNNTAHKPPSAVENVTHHFADTKPLQTSVTVPRILSPKPVRVSSASTSIEGSVLGDLRGIQSRRQKELLRKADALQAEQQRRETLSKRSTLPHGQDEQSSLRSSADLGSGPNNVYSSNPDLLQVKQKPELVEGAKPVPPPARRSQVAMKSRMQGDVERRFESNAPASEQAPRPSAVPQEDAPETMRGRSPPSIDGAGSLHVAKRGNAVPASRHSSQDFSMRRITPHMTGDSLANAIVASSLASSRAPSPAKSPAPSFGGRSVDATRMPFRHFKNNPSDSRTPSPKKASQYTMRKQLSADDALTTSTPKRNRKFFRKHPHKHHEGDRKRWRDTITETERKRYEGVWAANRGLFLETVTPEMHMDNACVQREQDCVTNLVVRDIWKRSKLPPFVLGEVWDLVDRSSTGRLDREEFVIGLWLIDQRLKGRKLPFKISSSLWSSVHGVQGIKIPKPKG
ncbi:MAG: Increased rDNA silencing protein [Chrysothrix sp. TS-e1954]|nr:MAG: Increased rDNA silencing protein [Chrysothrix sp. TS-e1954]